MDVDVDVLMGWKEVKFGLRLWRDEWRIKSRRAERDMLSSSARTGVLLLG